jgi:hypothetical protein
MPTNDVTLPHFLDLKRQARSIVRAHAAPTLRAAQHELARRLGYSEWGALVRRVPVPLPVRT